MKSTEHGQGRTGKRNCRCTLCGPLKAAYLKEKRAEGQWASRSEEGTYFKYGLTQQDLERLIQAQNNACAICATEFPNRRAMRIDHDHNCCSGARSCGGCVRGILCHGCNIKIGILDDQKLLAAAKKYLGTDTTTELARSEVL